MYESNASIGSQKWLQERSIAVGVNINTDFLRQADEGEDVNTTAVPIHQGRKQQLSDGVNQLPGKTLAARQVRIQNLDVTLPPESMEPNDYVAGM